MSAETPRPPADVMRAAWARHHGLKPERFVNLAFDVMIAALAAEGYSIVHGNDEANLIEASCGATRARTLAEMEGRAVHEGQVYDLERPPHSGSMMPCYRLRPVSQGIPATKEPQ